ncbi:sugar nucleotide-binding protein [Candidatus Woesearchaeota archaeon]|nr:sugar nucleotide-binding protein [Candidatus Woesearchaeota archaeon]
MLKINKKVLIVGANGFLGNKLVKVFSKEFAVEGTYHCQSKENLIQLDITNSEQTRELIKKLNPELILLTAAETNVDLCEKNPEYAKKFHVSGIKNVVDNCNDRKLVYYSTDSVFDGEKGDYVETDTPNPINVYAKTKLEGEKHVKSLEDHLVLRTCMLYSDQPDSPKFINWLIKNLSENKEVKVATDLHGTPTLIDDLANATLELIKEEKKGTYHVAGSSALSCYDMALRVADVFNFDKNLILPVKNKDLKRAAPRPEYGTLDISKLASEGIKMSTLLEGLLKIKESIGTKVAPSQYKNLEQCRICSSKNLEEYLDLGNMPLVNSYVKQEQLHREDQRFPLKIRFCKDCSLSQLSIVVNPEIMYKNYFYRSSVSKTFTNHCFEFAKQSVENFKLSQNDLVVDIASNDGCALGEFKKFGVKILGIDPAENLAKIANEKGVPTLPKFWNEETAKEVLDKYGEASLINASNVFAHVHDLDSFLRGTNYLLKGSGVFTIEVPYMLNFVNKTEFDTTYHEHLSYFLVKPLTVLFKKHNLEIFNIEKFTIHGGSMRVYVKKESDKTLKVNKDSIKWLLELEEDLGLHDISTYLEFSKDVERIKSDLSGLLTKLKKQGKTIAAYGASAKGTVLLNYCGIGKDLINYVVDDTPEKQGTYTPGQHVPIVNSSMLSEQKPDYLLLLAWNFAEELMNKTQDYKNKGGKYIVPIPSVRVI